MEWGSASAGGGRGDEEEEEVVDIDSLGGGPGFSVAMKGVLSACGMVVSDALEQSSPISPSSTSTAGSRSPPATAPRRCSGGTGEPPLN
jgi:hypothetical protein